jgi:hypothetical protein
MMGCIPIGSFSCVKPNVPSVLMIDISFPRVKTNLPSVPKLRCLKLNMSSDPLLGCLLPWWQVQYALCSSARLSHSLVSSQICSLIPCLDVVSLRQVNVSFVPILFLNWNLIPSCQAKYALCSYSWNLISSCQAKYALSSYVEMSPHFIVSIKSNMTYDPTLRCLIS